MLAISFVVLCKSQKFW